MTEYLKWKYPTDKRNRCGLCHKQIEKGDEYYLSAIEQSEEEREKFNGSKYNAKCVILHRKCAEK